MLIDKNEFLQLSRVHDNYCISLYMPKTNTEKDRITLKNHLRDAEKKLIKEQNLTEKEAGEITRPFRDVCEEDNWWRQEGDGLAVFIYDETFQYKFYPVEFESTLHVDKQLYLLPLSPLIHQDRQLLILVLSAEHAALYQMDRNGINEHPISSKLPRGIRDVAGYDYEQKSLQFRSGQGEANGGMDHGQGSGNQEEYKEEYRKYFRKIDSIINDEYPKNRPTLVLACVDYLYPLYKEVCKYDNLSEDHIKGNHEQTHPDKLYKEAIPYLEKKESEEYDSLKEEFQERLNNQEASFNIPEIVSAAIHGRVESLIIDRKSEIWGKYDSEHDKVDIENSDEVNNTSLLNLAAVHTIRNSGNVYLTDQMPAPGSPMIANFRFSY